MKLTFITLALGCFLQPLYSQVVQFPDTMFLNSLLTEYEIDKNHDKQIQLSEAQALTSLYLSDERITDLTGLEAFTSLTYLELYLVNPKMDLSKNVQLKSLWIRNNGLKKLDVSKNVKLDLLYCDQNQLDSIDVSNNTSLRTFWIWGNRLKKLDLSKNVKLESLKCGENLLSSLDLSNNPQLGYLSCLRNTLSSLDLTHNPYLNFVECWTNAPLKTICVTANQLQKATNNPATWVKDNAAVWSTCTVTGVQDDTIETPNDATIIGIYDMAGREIEVDQARNGLFVHTYSNGSTKKVFKP